MASWSERVPAGSLVVINDSRVFRARLLGHRVPSGGRVEFLLLRRVDGSDSRWLALARANRPLREGDVVRVGTLEVRVGARADGGTVVLDLESAGPIEAAIEREGRLPLPPYVRREADGDDAERYQTVYAREDGSVAAPTAGLHLTEEALARLVARGCSVARATLHVGVGTFRPVTAETLAEHVMHEERFEVNAELVAAVASARERGGAVVAVGTTVVRALESAADPRRPGHVVAQAAATRLFVTPGYRFRVVDALLTNFHMPRSTLLALVSAFAGTERVLAAYREAVLRRYRFFSYGDAMWIPERTS